MPAPPGPPAPLQPSRAPRVAFTGPAISYVGNRQLSCAGGNISLSGMLLFPPERGRPGEFLRIIFNLGERRWVDADAILVREATENVRYGWGVQFVQIAPHHKEDLLQYVGECLAAEELRRKRTRPSRARRGGAAAAPVQERRRAPFKIKDVTPIDVVEQRAREGFGNEQTPLRELYRKALKQLDRDDEDES